MAIYPIDEEGPDCHLEATVLNLALYRKHRSIFAELGCPTRVPDERVSAAHWSWSANVPYEPPLELNPSNRRLDVNAIGIARGPLIHILRAVELATGETLVVTLGNGPYVSSITARVWPSADAAAAIQEKVDTWVDDLGLQTFKWTAGCAA